MAGVSSTSRPVPTTDSAAQPTTASGCSTVATVADVLQGAGVGPGGRHHDQVGPFAEASSTAPDTSPVACDGHRVLGQGAGEGHAGSAARGAKRMSSERR